MPYIDRLTVNWYLQDMWSSCGSNLHRSVLLGWLCEAVKDRSTGTHHFHDTISKDDDDDDDDDDNDDEDDDSTSNGFFLLLLLMLLLLIGVANCPAVIVVLSSARVWRSQLAGKHGDVSVQSRWIISLSDNLSEQQQAMDETWDWHTTVITPSSSHAYLSSAWVSDVSASLCARCNERERMCTDNTSSGLPHY